MLKLKGHFQDVLRRFAEFSDFNFPPDLNFTRGKFPCFQFRNLTAHTNWADFPGRNAPQFRIKPSREKREENQQNRLEFQLPQQEFQSSKLSDFHLKLFPSSGQRHGDSDGELVLGGLLLDVLLLVLGRLPAEDLAAAEALHHHLRVQVLCPRQEAQGKEDLDGLELVLDLVWVGLERSFNPRGELESEDVDRGAAGVGGREQDVFAQRG